MKKIATEQETSISRYGAILDRGLVLLMGLPFKWDSITVRVSPRLVNQIIRKWGTSSSRPAVKLIQRELSNCAFDNRRDAELHDTYMDLADSVEDIAFWEEIQKHI